VVQYLPILAMIVLVALFVVGSFAASTVLAPKNPNPAKTAPYESGIVPEIAPAERFPVKFYLVAMTFIVLDVEIVFLYPFATVYRALGVYGLVAMGVFLVTLLVPFAYLLSTGALDWGPIRHVTERRGEGVLRASGAPGRDGMRPARAATSPGQTEPEEAA
jgi:NADH-quinone oxidoreductase subunit A